MCSENNEHLVIFYVPICSACNSILTVNDKLAFLMLPCRHFSENVLFKQTLTDTLAVFLITWVLNKFIIFNYASYGHLDRSPDPVSAFVQLVRVQHYGWRGGRGENWIQGENVEKFDLPI